MAVKGRVAIVTGAGAGLGRAYALHLAALGWRVLVNNRRRTVDSQGLGSAEAVAVEIRAAGGEAEISEEDVLDPQSGARLVGQALDAWGQLDGLVANAGVDQHAAFHRIAVADFLKIFESNFHGTLYVTHAAYGHMRGAGHGRIVLSTSSAALHGLHGLSAYAASKAALLGLMKTLAAEGQARDVYTNVVAPYARTRMTAGHGDAALLEPFAAEAVAPLIATLLAPQSEVNGEILIVGAGRWRRAAIVEQADSEDLPLAAEHLRRGAPLREFKDALEAFRDFAKREGS